ncbi:MAG: FABP family protein [Chromatiales bacterium]|nr:MAG: FABP family protein [Chromatiales bacterium]
MIDNKLGPLAILAGTWEGDRGTDVAPGPDLGEMTTAFRERMVFEPVGQVSNHQQCLFGLRYATTVWPAGEDEPFHEEVGYWLWDATNQQVMRSFTVPRGYTVLAGGTADSDAARIQVAADLGSATYGICSNQFLDQAFRTVRFQCNMTIHDADSFSYEEDTQIRIRDQADLFHHRDSNQLIRTG